MGNIIRWPENPPKSMNFQDGRDAEGTWTGEDGKLYQQVAGSSGVYLIVKDPVTGAVIRDDRPWQMTV